MFITISYLGNNWLDEYCQHRRLSWNTERILLLLIDKVDRPRVTRNSFFPICRTIFKSINLSLSTDLYYHNTHEYNFSLYILNMIISMFWVCEWAHIISLYKNIYVSVFHFHLVKPEFNVAMRTRAKNWLRPYLSGSRTVEPQKMTLKDKLIIYIYI